MDRQQRRLLLVEDDTDLAGMLMELLAVDGYATDWAHDGQHGLRLGLSRPYDVAVVDRRLPALDGLELVVRLRRRSVPTRVLMLTAVGRPADRVLGLDSGADDYLTKPFDVAEFRARVRALERRVFEPVETVPIGSAQLEPGRRLLHLPDGRETQLTARECALIQVLAARPRWVYNRLQLQQRVFPEAGSAAIVDTYVHYLRRKAGREVIRTVHGLGYRLGSL